MVTRRMVRTESTVATTLVSSTMVTLAGLLVALNDWRTPDISVLAVLAVGGCLMGTAHFLMMEAFRFGDAALISPFRYSSVLWAVLIGIVVFGDWPDRQMLLGCVIVVGSGLYILHREVYRAQATGRER